MQLIFLSVIMLLISVKSEESIRDLSYKCSRGENTLLSLTTGIGISDTSVTMIASDGLFQCTIEYSVNSEDYVMVVIQFPDWRPNEKACNDDHNSVLMVSENFEENVCTKFQNKSDSIHRKLGKGKVSVYINNLRGMRTIKITATSMRDPQGLRCSNGKEVECSYDSRIYCMSGITNCDGHPNCGMLNASDEKDEYCKAKITVKTVLYTIVTIIILLGLILSLALNVMPRNRRTFIYRVYEETSLFDVSEDLVNIEINIQIMFPSKFQ